MTSEDIKIFCASANFQKLASELRCNSVINNFNTDNSLAVHTISILLHLDFIKRAIGNINDRLTALENVTNDPTQTS